MTPEPDDGEPFDPATAAWLQSTVAEHGLPESWELDVDDAGRVTYSLHWPDFQIDVTSEEDR